MMLSVQTCLIGLLGWLAALQLASAAEVDLEEVRQRFEQYALEKITSTGLTLDDLKRAAAEYNSLSEDDQLSKLPGNLGTLLVDLVITPMKHVDLQLDEDEPEHEAKWVKRAEDTYKELRRAIKGKKVKPYTTVKIPKFKEWVNKGTDEVTLEHFMNVKNEYNTWMKYYAEVADTMDIYGHITEIKKIYNYINEPKMKVFMKTVFKDIKPGADPRVLIKKFRDVWVRERFNYY